MLNVPCASHFYIFGKNTTEKNFLSFSKYIKEFMILMDLIIGDVDFGHVGRR